MSDKKIVPKIIVTNILIFLLWNIYGLINPDFMIKNFLVSWINILQGRVWTLLTSAFSHNMLFHLLISMFVLYNFGFMVEKILGSNRFLFFYFVAGITGSLAHCLASAFLLHQPAIAALGASGAIAGVLVLFALIYPRELIFIFGLIPIPALWAIIALIGFDSYGLINQTKGYPTSIGYGAHLGGALVGFIYFFIFFHDHHIEK
jgi:membrane associated rhomboid family serine protease